MHAPLWQTRPAARAAARTRDAGRAGRRSLHEFRGTCYAPPDSLSRHNDQAASAASPQFRLERIVPRELEPGDHFPYVVLAAAAHIVRKAAERRGAPDDAQRRTVERLIAGAALHARPALFFINGAILKNGNVYDQLAIQLLAALLRKIQGADVFNAFLQRSVIHRIAHFTRARRDLRLFRPLVVVFD